MSDFIFTVLTAEGCGHCHHSRGDGLLGNGKHFLQYDFLKSLSKPIQSQKPLTLLNIHFSSMGGRQNMVKEISKFTYLENRIQQEMYSNTNDKASVTVSSVAKDGKVSRHGNKIVKDNGKDINWGQFIDKKISKKIENYTYYFPCFIIFRKKDWLEGKDFLGITNSGFTILDKDGVYKLEKNPQTLGQRSVEPSSLAIAAASGSLDFKPHKNLKEEEGEKEKKEEGVKKETGEKKEEEKKKETGEKKEEVKKEIKNTCGFLIKHYDDEE